MWPAVSLRCWAHPVHRISSLYQYAAEGVAVASGVPLCFCLCFLYAFPSLLENFFIAVLVLLSHLLYSLHLGKVSTGGEMTFLREHRGRG